MHHLRPVASADHHHSMPGAAQLTGSASSSGEPAGRSVLIVEAHPATNELLAATMSRAGYQVRRVVNADQAIAAVTRRVPDLVLLDIERPGPESMSLIEQLRCLGGATLGIIAITGRAAEHHRLAGFTAGVDDFVTKPFSAEEISLRAAGIVRRLAGHRPTPPPVLQAGPIRLDRAARRATIRGTLVGLTRIEYLLLLDLMSHPGAVRAHEQLIASTWSDGHDAEVNTVIVHIQRLRKKLAAVDHSLGPITTVRGVGYRFDLSPDPDAPAVPRANARVRANSRRRPPMSTTDPRSNMLRVVTEPPGHERLGQ